MKILTLLSLTCCISILGYCLPLSGMEFPYHPTKEITLISGKQISEHPVTTKMPEAQKFFNQGLTFLYGFNHDAAYWSFQKAVALDPSLAMGYWGMALALGPNINMDVTHKAEGIAFSHIQKATELTENISESEKDYIFALAKRYTDVPNPDLKKLNFNYMEAMKQLRFKYPDDPDAAVLYAESAMDVNPWKQWTVQGEPLPGTMEIVETLETVLKRQPNHLGANHYYIHAIEASKHPEYAMVSAERLRKLAPSLGHITHMPSHIYLLVGDYHEAATANEAAIAADLSYIRQYGLDGIYPLHYLTHNYYFLIRALSMEGRLKSAITAADELNAFYFPHFKEMPELEYYLSAKMFVLLRFHKWKELLEIKPPKAYAKEEMAVTEALWHFARGLSFAAIGDQENALNEKSLFTAQKNKIPKDAVFGFNSVEPIFQIAENVLLAEMAKFEGDFLKEIAFLKEAVLIQDTLNYNEPPDWYFPVRESLGMAFLRNNQIREAEEVFRQDLNIHPRNPRSLYGLLLTLKKQSRPTDSFFVQKEFEQASQYSDSTLSPSDL